MTTPRVALGTVQWGSPYGVANRTGVPDGAGVRRIIDVARRFDVQVLDTARAYLNAESVIGDALGTDRSFRIVTKIAPEVLTEGDAEAPALVRRSLAMSSAALRLETFDTVLLHRALHRTAAGGACWKVLEDQKEAGKITRIGVSVDSPEEASEAASDPSVDALQVAASLLDQRLLRDGFFDRASERRKQIYVRSVFLQGVAHLPDAEIPSHLRPLVPTMQRIDEVARHEGLSRADVFLLFAAALPSVTLVIGTETAEQTEKNLLLLQTRALAASSIEELKRLPTLDPRLLTPARWGELPR